MIKATVGGAAASSVTWCPAAALTTNLPRVAALWAALDASVGFTIASKQEGRVEIPRQAKGHLSPDLASDRDKPPCLKFMGCHSRQVTHDCRPRKRSAPRVDITIRARSGLNLDWQPPPQAMKASGISGQFRVEANFSFLLKLLVWLGPVPKLVRNGGRLASLAKTNLQALLRNSS